HRDQAVDGPRLRRHRQRAVREPEDGHAVRRRQVGADRPDRLGQDPRGLTSPAKSSNAARARGPQTVPGPPFIRITTPMASATSAAVTPCRTADRACATTQPSHSLVTAMASAISSFTPAGSAPSPIAAPCSAAYPAYTSGMAARSRRPDTFSSSWISRAVLTPGLLVAVVRPRWVMVGPGIIERHYPSQRPTKAAVVSTVD